MNNHYEYWLKNYIDYEDQILWELFDACKLIAGYVPYCDNNTNLNVELMPKTQRNIADMKDILSEFNNDDKKIVRVVPYDFEHTKRQYIYAIDFIEWAKSRGYQIPEEISRALKIKTENHQKNLNDSKPWFIKDPRDPEPKYEWYIPARYFARELVTKEPYLLNKREKLASRVSKLLIDVGC
jgi:hypothetical protein